MQTPNYLQHKPIIAVHDYDQKDGHYINNTDARALSLGNAQYDKDEMSAKVFRHTGNNWSRQSEELPIHRVLDLAILITASMVNKENDKGSQSSLNEELVAPERHKELMDYYQMHSKQILPRLKELKALLNTLIP